MTIKSLHDFRPILLFALLPVALPLAALLFLAAAGEAVGQARVEQVALASVSEFPEAASGTAARIEAVDSASARRAIESANAQWLDAFRLGDAETLAEIYAPDASLFTPDSTSLEGRDSIVAWLGAQHRSGKADATLKTLDVVCVGDVAYEVGTYGFRVASGDGSVPGDSGRYFAIWKSSGDGDWRYKVGIWSSGQDDGGPH